MSNSTVSLTASAPAEAGGTAHTAHAGSEDSATGKDSPTQLKWQNVQILTKMYKRTVKRDYWQLVPAETKGQCRTGPWEALAIRTPQHPTQVSTGCSRELSFMVLRAGSSGSQHVLTWRTRPSCDLFRTHDLREQRGHGNTKYCFPKLRAMLKQSSSFLMHQGTARTEREPAGISGSTGQHQASKKHSCWESPCPSIPPRDPGSASYRVRETPVFALLGPAKARALREHSELCQCRGQCEHMGTSTQHPQAQLCCIQLNELPGSDAALLPPYSHTLNLHTHVI